jgi:hypothetical protein
VNHKTYEQCYFYEVQGKHVVECEDYIYLAFHAMWSRRSALLKNLLPPSSGQEMEFPKIKWCSIQDRSLAHEMAEGEANMQDSSLHHCLTQDYQYA